MYIDVAYCYRLSSMVCQSVTHVSTAEMAELIEMPFGLKTGGLREPCIRWGPVPRGKGQFIEGKGRPLVKYRNTLRSSVQKWLKRSRCRLGCGLGSAQGIVLDGGPHVLRDVAMAINFWLSMGYNFRCMIANVMLFDSRGGFSGSSYLIKTS